MNAQNVNIAIFASGSGSNAEEIVKHFDNHGQITVSAIFTNKKDAYVIERAKKLRVPCHIFNRDDFYQKGQVLHELKKLETGFIVLAGFLWLVPRSIVNQYRDKILNIHPALLPKYGGKGMYGDRVHKKVWENKEAETGITIHRVNEKYDEGDIVFQKKIAVDENDTPGTIAEKVHQLEYHCYPTIIEQFILSNV